VILEAYTIGAVHVSNWNEREPSGKPYFRHPQPSVKKADGHVSHKSLNEKGSGAPGGIRSHNILFRRQTLSMRLSFGVPSGEPLRFVSNVEADGALELSSNEES
jgi:hypothetical protein